MSSGRGASLVAAAIRSRPVKAKPEEPVILTLSSDEEDEDSQNDSKVIRRYLNSGRTSFN